MAKVTKPTSEGKPKKPTPAPVKAYLLIYNLAMLVAWSREFSIIVAAALNGNIAEIWSPENQQYFKIIQGLQALEIVHGIIGFTRSSVITAITQIGARNFHLYFSLVGVDKSVETNWPALPMMLGFWTFAELFRYPFYIQAVLGTEFYPISWGRYNQFILNYPFGFGGEMVIFHFYKGPALYEAYPEYSNLLFAG